MSSDPALGSVAVVVMNDPTKNAATANGCIRFINDDRNRCLLIDTLMRARRIEEPNVFTHHASKMGLVDDQQLVETLTPHGCATCDMYAPAAKFNKNKRVQVLEEQGFNRENITGD